MKSRALTPEKTSLLPFYIKCYFLYLHLANNQYESDPLKPIFGIERDKRNAYPDNWLLTFKRLSKYRMLNKCKT